MLLRSFSRAGGNAACAGKSCQLFGRDLQVAVHEYYQWIAAVVLHDQGLDHAVLCYPELPSGPCGSTLLLITIQVFGEADLCQAQLPYCRGDRGFLLAHPGLSAIREEWGGAWQLFQLGGCCLNYASHIAIITYH